MESKVWIIGGTSGIGAAVSRELMAYAMHEKEDVAISVSDEIDANVVDSKALSSFYLEVGPFDHAVYSAGINKLAWLEDIKEPDMMEIMDVNVMGFMRLMSIIAASINKPYSVTAISSDAATHPMRTSMPYCASKAALNMAVKCAARELAPGVRVNAVSPGIVHGTGLTQYTDEAIQAMRGWSKEKAMQYEVSQIPAGRRASVSEIALVVRSVMFGPDYLTGSIIEVNGGR